MRILITNDDGIESAGLKVLEQIVNQITNDIWVVAPETDQSEGSTAPTVGKPIELRDLGKRRYAVNGTPADCVIVGVRHLLLKTPPDLVLSGVNNGENLADDVTHAGTVAAAIAGTLFGVPSIALSLVTGKEKSKPYWETPKKHGPVILRRLLDLGWPKNVLLNVNFPDCAPEAVKGIAITAQGKRKPEEWSIEPVEDQRGHQLFIGRHTSKVRRGCDLWAVQSARISISPLRIDLTDSEAYDQFALDTSLLEC